MLSRFLAKFPILAMEMPDVFGKAQAGESLCKQLYLLTGWGPPFTNDPKHTVLVCGAIFESPLLPFNLHFHKFSMAKHVGFLFQRTRRMILKPVRQGKTQHERCAVVLFSGPTFSCLRRGSDLDYLVKLCSVVIGLIELDVCFFLRANETL